MKYDYLIVGSGLFGSVFAHEMTKKGKNVLLSKKGTILVEMSILQKNMA